ncbi:MAG: hypothetical protein ACRYG7_03465 [Janthinobacterium lividum]
MFQTANFGTSAPTFAAQEAYLAIERQPRDEAQKHLLAQLRRHLAAHTDQADLRDLAPEVGELMGEGYQVGCGSSHIWILADDSNERLAVVADRLTTAYRDWFEPRPQVGPRLSSRPEQGLPVAGHAVTTSPVTQ